MIEDTLKTFWPEWQITKLIGSGSFGDVYEAIRTDHSVESHAAIKVITIPKSEAELNSLRAEGFTEESVTAYLRQMVDDFVGEIQIMESFKGVQNIVSVEDYKVIEHTDAIRWDIFIRMELLTPLVDYISNRTLSEAEVIKLGIDICTALERCATQNIIHRDIKPENIFVNRFNDFKLGDFGVARKLENMTSGMSQKGTYNYMAPEVLRETHYDATVDIYSLGLVLYRFLNNNRLPFLNSDSQYLNPNDRAEALRRRMDGEPLPKPCNASPAMAEVILRACSYNPEKRFPTAAEMKHALRAVADGTYVSEEDELSRTRTVRNAPQSKKTSRREQEPELSLKPERDRTPNTKPANRFLWIIPVLCLAAAAVFGLNAWRSRNADEEAAEPAENTDSDASQPEVQEDDYSGVYSAFVSIYESYLTSLNNDGDFSYLINTSDAQRKRFEERYYLNECCTFELTEMEVDNNSVLVTEHDGNQYYSFTARPTLLSVSKSTGSREILTPMLDVEIERTGLGITLINQASSQNASLDNRDFERIR